VFPDFVEFIASLNARGVRFLIVGGYAVAFHARPRATKDIDVLIDRSPANARRARVAIVEFLGGEAPEITVEKLTSPRTVLVLGRSPVRIDILTDLEGLGFRAAWSRRVEATFGSERAFYIGLEDLVRVKEIAGRAVDLEDVRVLRRTQRAKRR
jgi:predicted nucleotidyltransferase